MWLNDICSAARERKIKWIFGHFSSYFEIVITFFYCSPSPKQNPLTCQTHPQVSVTRKGWWCVFSQNLISFANWLERSWVQCESSHDWGEGGVKLTFRFSTTLYTFHRVPHNAILPLLEVHVPFIKYVTHTSMEKLKYTHTDKHLATQAVSNTSTQLTRLTLQS